MEMQTIDTMGTPAQVQGARPEIQIPTPPMQQVATNTDEQLALEARHKIEPLPPSRYLRVRGTTEIHKWSPEFGARSDLMEPYNPTVAELIKFGEYANDLLGWGYAPADLWQNGATAEQLVDAAVPLKTLVEIGVPPEKLKALGFAIQIEQAPTPVLTAPATPTLVVPASAPVVQTSTIPPPPGA